MNSSAGTITINGGIITATGKGHCAGIGGASNSGAGTVVINGGTVTASGGSGSAGIGSGLSGNGVNVTIIGGNVYATRGRVSSPKNSSGTGLSLKTIVVPADFRLSSITVTEGGSSYTYGTRDMVPIDGKLYVYAPASAVLSVNGVECCQKDGVLYALHTYGEDAVCTLCGTACTHETYAEGKCTLCGTACTHEEYADGQCTRCGEKALVEVRVGESVTYYPGIDEANAYAGTLEGSDTV